MQMSGFPFIQSLAVTTALAPNPPLAVAGNNLRHATPSFPTYIERQAYTGMPLTTNARHSALVPLRYERAFDAAHASLLGRGKNTSSASAGRYGIRNADRSADRNVHTSGIRVRRNAATLSTPQSFGTNRPAGLFARAYADAYQLTIGDACTRLKADDLSLYQSWNTLSSVAQIDAPPADSVLASSVLGRAYAAALFAAYLQAEPGTDDQTAISIAQSYLRQLAPAALDQPARTALYQALLQRGLQWIAVDKVDLKKLSATHILQTVCRYRKEALNTRSALTQRLQHERDVIIDEAALIAAHAGQETANTSMVQMRAQFATALIDEWQDAALAQMLLPSSVLPPKYAKFWHDGRVMRNTRGKDLAQIVSILYAAAPQEAEHRSIQTLIAQANRSRYLLAQPEGLIAVAQRQRLIEAMHGDPAALLRYAVRPNSVAIGGVWLTRDELSAIVEKGMRDLALDIDYASGTPLHAIATIVHRLGPLHGINVDAYNNTSALMHAYNRLQQAWQHAPRYPIKPSLCAAYFLAQTSDVRLFDQASTLSSEQQIAQQVAADILPALRQAGGQLALQSDYWNKIISDFSEGRHPGYRSPTIFNLPVGRRAIYSNLHTYIAALKAAPETIHYANPVNLNHQLDAYLKQRLLAQAPLPSYNEDFLIEQILRQQLMMNNTDLIKQRALLRLRPAVLRGGTPLTKVTLIPVDEFKERISDLHTEMKFNGHRINVPEALNAAKQQALVGLLKHPIIEAKAKEILRQHGNLNRPSDSDDLQFVMAHSIIGLPQEASLVDALLDVFNALFSSPTVNTMLNAIASGEPSQILGLLPFIVPLYEIEEGIRCGERQRAFEGALHFGEDALLTVLGAGVEGILQRQLARDAESMLLVRSRMSPGERAGVDMVHQMAQLFPQAAPQRLAQRRVIIDEDAFKVWTPTQPKVLDVLEVQDAPAQTLPKMLEAQRRPDNHVHQTLYLSDEQRIVLVQPSGSGLDEVNLRGQLVPTAPLIFGSLKSGRGYRLSRSSGLPGGAMGVDASELRWRHTVASVLRFWRSIAGLRNIRMRRAEPKAIINALFKDFTNDPYGSYAAFENFWLKAYARSDTAVVILNVAYDRLISCGSYCELEFNAERAQVRGDSITFLGAEGLSKLQYVALDRMENFQRERMWVHESIHWTTKLGDALQGDALDSRGATPYLTDRILSEVGAYPPLLQRIAYQAPPAFEVDEIAHRVWSGRLRALHDWNIAENNMMDATLNVGRDFPSSMVVLGQKITDRITVLQGLALSARIKSLGKFGSGNIDYLRQLVQASFTPYSFGSGRSAMLRRLMQDSSTFRILASAWSRAIKYERVTVESADFEGKHAATSLRQSLAHHISVGGKTVWLNTEPLYYFSDFDVTALSEVRRYAGAMLDLFLRDLIPHEQKLRLPDWSVERGLDVLLENEVLRQIGANEPRRISAQLSKNLDAYLRHQTTVTRAAISENGYLQQACRTAASSSDDDILALSN